MTFRPAIDFEVATTSIVFKLNVNRQLCFGEIIYSEILEKHIFNLTTLKIVLPEDSDTCSNIDVASSVELYCGHDQIIDRACTTL